MVCLPCSHGVGPTVMKNCEPLVPRPPWMPGVRHREHVGLGEVELGVDLVVELVARAADALTERVAALDHEAGDDAVEDDVRVQRVIRLLAGGRMRPLDLTRREADEVLHGLRGVVPEEVDHDRPWLVWRVATAV